jgi:hypothetical protein
MNSRRVFGQESTSWFTGLEDLEIIQFLSLPAKTKWELWSSYHHHHPPLLLLLLLLLLVVLDMQLGDHETKEFLTKL